MTDSLAPPWLTRQRRRHVDHALRKLIRRNACSVCGKPFEPNTATATGFDASGNVAVAGECCAGKLTEIFGMGLSIGLAGRAGIPEADPPWKVDDREWFEQNRQRSHRIRLPMPGELDQIPEAPDARCGMATFMLVQQIEAGKRQRVVFYLTTELLPIGDDEATAHALFEVTMKREPAPPDQQALINLIEKYRLEPKQ